LPLGGASGWAAAAGRPPGDGRSGRRPLQCRCSSWQCRVSAGSSPPAVAGQPAFELPERWLRPGRLRPLAAGSRRGIRGRRGFSPGGTQQAAAGGGLAIAQLARRPRGLENGNSPARRWAPPLSPPAARRAAAGPPHSALDRQSGPRAAAQLQARAAALAARAAACSYWVAPRQDHAWQPLAGAHRPAVARAAAPGRAPQAVDWLRVAEVKGGHRWRSPGGNRLDLGVGLRDLGPRLRRAGWPASGTSEFGSWLVARKGWFGGGSSKRAAAGRDRGGAQARSPGLQAGIDVSSSWAGSKPSAVEGQVEAGGRAAPQQRHGGWPPGLR